MTVTDETIAELERTLKRLQEYRDHVMPTEYFSGNTSHSAAVRATLDCSRQLVLWRHAPLYYPNKVK